MYPKLSGRKQKGRWCSRNRFQLNRMVCWLAWRLDKDDCTSTLFSLTPGICYTVCPGSCPVFLRINWLIQGDKKSREGMGVTPSRQPKWHWQNPIMEPGLGGSPSLSAVLVRNSLAKSGCNLVLSLLMTGMVQLLGPVSLKVAPSVTRSCTPVPCHQGRISLESRALYLLMRQAVCC